MMRSGVHGSGRGQGFTLVELMVALAVGGLLMAGVLRIFQSNKQSYRLQDSLSRVQENARFATELLRSKVRQAGYKSGERVVHEETEEIVFPPLVRAGLTGEETPALVYSLGDLTFAAGQVVAGTDNNADSSDDVLDGSDTLAVRYQGALGGAVRDCVGNPIAVRALQIDLYYINERDMALHCASCGPVCQTGQPAVDQAVIDGVESLQIRYGVVTDSAVLGARDARSDCYLDASNPVTTQVSDCVSGVNFTQVAGVRLGLLLHTPGNTGRFLRDTDDTSTYSVAGSDVVVNDTDEHRVRRVVATTIGLRNRIR